MKSKKAVIAIVTVLILIVICVVAFAKPIKAKLKVQQTQRNYQSLMDNSETPREIIQQAIKKGSKEPVYLVIYKSTCPHCQQEFKKVAQKVKEDKAEGATILVAQAPESGLISDFPQWVSNFKLPPSEVKLPAVVRYDLRDYSTPIPFPFTNWEVYESNGGWTTQIPNNLYWGSPN